MIRKYLKAMLSKPDDADWLDVKEAARNTINREGAGSLPSEEWKRKILIAEHSPIRLLRWKFLWVLPSWVSVHFVRHKFGVEHFVSTQRSDRTGEDRNKKPQDSPVSHLCEANAQALINISRKRLCSCASPETRSAWQEVKKEIGKNEPAVASAMVRECVYRGFCPEFNCCGYVHTDSYRTEREAYTAGFEK